ncbi:hypothetical protein DERP_000412 [Dermatophagoides pteronyssinus]|uniref:Uncharacterized protein n=1 Tax=Dermatophagoides pteronyssinus TaxID=6956 RepID=A0ABQ8J043_DERPT|nr:hypothetical protein DERP_000412 [Dermatophagoides pteronyssinus]
MNYPAGNIAVIIKYLLPEIISIRDKIRSVEPLVDICWTSYSSSSTISPHLCQSFIIGFQDAISR